MARVKPRVLGALSRCTSNVCKQGMNSQNATMTCNTGGSSRFAVGVGALLQRLSKVTKRWR